MNKKKTILVIDDEPAVLELLRVIFESGGYDVITTLDGATGMQYFRDSEVDLVILDIKMPGPGGNQVIQSIRETSNTPIIIVSGMNGKQSKVQSLSLGADDYITKPFYPKELLLRVKNILRRR